MLERFKPRRTSTGNLATRRDLIGASVVAGAALAAGGTALAAAAAPRGHHGPPGRMSSVDLRMAMRKLWEEHITYTRNFIISALGGLGDQPAVTERLLRNQDDIGNAVKPFYGDAAGAELTRLLRAHILIAADIVTAAKAGNNPGVAAKQQEWSANGRQLAAFLAHANPHWSQATLASMLQRHLDLTTGEVLGRLHSDWAADIRSYDEGHQHMLMFADILTTGIVQQFPRRFV